MEDEKEGEGGRYLLLEMVAPPCGKVSCGGRQSRRSRN